MATAYDRSSTGTVAAGIDVNRRSEKSDTLEGVSLKVLEMSRELVSLIAGFSDFTANSQKEELHPTPKTDAVSTIANNLVDTEGNIKKATDLFIRLKERIGN